MSKLAEAIRSYVDAAIDHELANLDVGSDGYTYSHPEERQARDRALDELRLQAIVIERNLDGTNEDE